MLAIASARGGGGVAASLLSIGGGQMYFVLVRGITPFWRHLPSCSYAFVSVLLAVHEWFGLVGCALLIQNSSVWGP